MIYEMRNIIADTSCLIVLEKINMLYLLKELYGTILVSKENNLIVSLKCTTEQLKKSGFRISNELEQEILKYD